MKYVPYSQLADVPHIIVDGAAQDSTVLTLSHWPGSDSPAQFRADTSTEMVLNYLSTPGADKEHAARARAVSNNHFDEDGLCAVWALCYPKKAERFRDQLVDVATAGDFAIYRRPYAAKVVFTIRSYADPEHSPVAQKLEGDDGTGSARYQALLPLLEEFLKDPDCFGPYWDDEWSAMLKSKTAMVTGEVELHEIPHVDLAVAQAPEPLHPMVLYNSTERLRVLTVLPGGRYCLRYRYESWVQFASRAVMPRVDLTPLLPRLQAMEQENVQWVFEGNAAMTPSLQPLGDDSAPAPSSLGRQVLVDELVNYFERAQNRADLLWNPTYPGGTP